MKNIIDYAAEQTRSFADSGFNEVDSLILSKLAYLHFDGFVPGLSDAAAPVRLKDMAAMADTDALFHDTWESKSSRRLFFALADNPRFYDIEAVCYVDRIDAAAEKQFSAVTFLLADGSAYIAYRGTDSTLVGWKEDFNMAFMSPVPSQQEGVAYLNAVAGRVPGNLKIGGHSKGGNIAVYSSVKCRPAAQKRITHVFSHDGPGFRDEIFVSSEYAVVKDRIHKTLPQSSIIGMLLQHQEHYRVVKSNRIWLMQHDPFSWLVTGTGFQYAPSVKKGARYMNRTLNEWAGSLDDGKRALFVNTLFQIIQATDAVTFYDLTGDWQKKAAAVLGAVKEIDDETRKFLLETIRLLFVLALRNIREAGGPEAAKAAGAGPGPP